jgi:5-methylcytosine-specific restriction endonuclease McrA
VDDRIEKIRELLDEVASTLEDNPDRPIAPSFNALEIPGIVSSVVRYLQPQLLAIEAAIYWYMFDRSILQHGQQYCRVSTRGLRTGVVKSGRGNARDGDLALASVRNALRGLEIRGAILQTGEPNRDGTLYKVLLPDEIPECAESMRKAQIEFAPSAVDEKKEGDFYNVPDNRMRVFDRDEYKCRYCGKQLTRFSATLDHLQPISQGGDNSFENLTTACLHCNSQRGARPFMDVLSNNRKEGD